LDREPITIQLKCLPVLALDRASDPPGNAGLTAGGQTGYHQRAAPAERWSVSTKYGRIRKRGGRPLHWIAMITMLIDHIGAVFHPNELAPWRIIGRIAFPIYTFALYLGYLHTRNMKRYMLRLLVLALLSQPPFMFAFGTAGLNVIFTLLVSLLAQVGADRLKSPGLMILFYIIVGAFMEWSNMDYGAYGLVLVLIFRYTREGWMVIAHFVLNLLYELWSFRYIGYTYYQPFTSVQQFSIISTIVISLFQARPAVFHRKVPRWLWISFYPAHLAVIALIVLNQSGFDPVLQNIVDNFHTEYR
jgi:hypothetical protein